MKNSWYKKGIVFGIIVLFIAVAVVPSTGTIVVENELLTELIIDGPPLGILGEPYYLTILFTCEEGCDFYLHIDWDDGNVEEWIGPFACGEEVILAHSYQECGTYIIRVNARDCNGYQYNATLEVTIVENHPPDAPFIDGEKGVIIGVEFDYYFNATDPDGDNVSYCIDWGDGTYEEWTGVYPSGEEITRSHTYNFYGTFVITARAIDIHGLVGPEGCYIPEWKWRNNKQSAQQSSTGSSSQNAMSVIPLSRTIINNGSLSGYVKNILGTPIEGALVRVHFHKTYEEDFSDSTGYYNITNIPICKCLKYTTCSKENYKTKRVLLAIAEDTTRGFILISIEEILEYDIESIDKSISSPTDNLLFMRFLEQFPLLREVLLRLIPR